MIPTKTGTIFRIFSRREKDIFDPANESANNAGIVPMPNTNIKMAPDKTDPVDAAPASAE